jgi:exodeoxyribonuclease VII small subunit
MPDPFPPDLTFEDAYRELETIIVRLEAGSLSLDESLDLFERGQRLSNWCESQLDAADLRVTRLSADGQTDDDDDFEDGEDEDEPPF